MKLITESLTAQLLANGRAQRAAIDADLPAIDFKPVVKLFTPDAQCTWQYPSSTGLFVLLHSPGTGESKA